MDVNTNTVKEIVAGEKKISFYINYNSNNSTKPEKNEYLIMVKQPFDNFENHINMKLINDMRVVREIVSKGLMEWRER